MNRNQVSKSLILFMTCFAFAAGFLVSKGLAVPPGQRVKGKVTVILDKLPDEYKEKMVSFHEKVENYINNREWVEEDYVAPFTIGFQLFLEHSPSSVEDRYRCSLVVTGPDIQYSDKRSIFPFQENETIQETGAFVPVNGIIDFYVYLIIANELDKYGLMGGDKYFEAARAILQEAKFSRYAFGWIDWRDDLIQMTLSENYKKFRELKDFYFYALWATDEEISQRRKYMLQALQKLEEVLTENKDNLAAKQFVDAHYSEVINLFKNSGKSEPFKILIRLDPDRKEMYEEHLGTN